MGICILCATMFDPDGKCRCNPAVASDCSGAEAGTIGCGAEGGNPKRAGDSRREVEELLNTADGLNNLGMSPTGTARCLIKALRILNENR